MPPRTKSNGVKRKHDDDDDDDASSSSSSSLSPASDYEDKPVKSTKLKKVKSETPSKTAKSRKTANGKANVKQYKPGESDSEGEEDSDITHTQPATAARTTKSNGKPKAAAKAEPLSSDGDHSDESSSSVPTKTTKSPKAKGKGKAAAPPRPVRTGTQSASSKAAALEWLLSDEAYELANPFPKPPVKPSKSARASLTKSPYFTTKDENERLEGGLLRYPHSKLTPFQCLLSALLLSKPLSHKLGIRTICTLFNPPFDFGIFEKLEDADEERRLESLWVARTQHKDKTAIQMGDLVDGVRGLNGPGEEDELGGIRRAIQDLPSTFDAQERVGHMLRSIKGIGPIGVGVFLRRIQEQWPEVFPFADKRCLDDARAFGLITECQGPNELSALVDENREKFVKLLDTLIGLDLERKLDECVDKFW
ncbi:hypothetical protein IAR55_002391 [Kwoniella newhampshirensis]|uniref:HhH-GPD domain-containing protein n=1 Tax=Kwoniella newhampshirensis TaxID=1651941 RepID=A0AAW0YTE8_9TREE